MSEASGPRCLAVMYHYVRDGNDAEPWMSEGVVGLTTREFQDQLAELCRCFEPVDWPTFYAWTLGRGSIPRRCFLLTFDDGLTDHAETVVPILERCGIRGVFFPSGDALMTQSMLPAHAMHLLLSMLGEQKLEEAITNWLSSNAKGTDFFGQIDERQVARMYHYESPGRGRLKYLLHVMLPLDLRRRVMNQLFCDHVGSPARWSKQWYLDWDDMIAMQSMGHTIGAHGYHHDPYLRLTAAQRRKDAKRIGDLFIEGLGHDVRPFSYPFGSYDEDCTVALKEAGFVQAFTTDRRWISETDAPFCLPRVDTICVGTEIEQEMGACQPA